MQPSLVPGDIKEKNIVFASRRRMVRWRIIALLIFAVTIQVQSQVDSNGFLSIDCGLPTNSSYVDNATSIKYVSDEQFIDTGNNSEISTNYSREFNTLRYFPTGTRNCYTMRSLTVGFKYLVRAGFYYGNYDNKNKLPIFDIYFGINFWNTIDPSSSLQYEIIVNATTDYLEFCLVNTGNGDPYISWLHLRQVNSPYLTVNSTQSLHLIKRLNIGGGNQQLVMYPDDINDLWWSSYSDTGWKEISTNSTIQPDPDLQTPSVVMQTAATTSSTQQPLNIVWNSDDKSTKYYFILRFYEIRTSSTGRREFNVLVNGFKAFPESIILDPQNPWDFSTHRRSGYTNYTVSLVATSISTLPPLINAFELHKVSPVGVPTYSADVAAINSVKKYHNIKKGWSGDPCLPSQFLWTGITCTTDSSNNARITGLNLSSSSLTGPLSNSIGNLTALEFLDLSNNDLSGSLPSSLDNIKALKLLDIRENPNISTALPPELDKKQKNRSLDYRFEGMNWMSSPQFPKKKNITIAVGVGVGVPLLVLVVIATFIWLKRMKYKPSIAPNENDCCELRPLGNDHADNGANIPQGENPNGELQAKQAEEISLKCENRKFNYNDLIEITNNFKDIIGKGGFGKVCLGNLENGVQVAVKVRTESSGQGVKEFKSEAMNLTRALHENLVSLVGYCTEKSCMALVYEYMQEGNLQDKLKGETPPSWRQRLRIAYESALGLEYLHNVCNPPIIHRDVKTNNILLNANLEAKIADFGLSRAFESDAESRVLTIIAGTAGYMDPEYCSSNELTAKSDVYSFGVVLLEIITGRPATRDSQGRILVQWVRQKLSEEPIDIKSIVDPRMEDEYETNSFWKVTSLACWCTKDTSSERPTMLVVVAELKETLDLVMSMEETHIRSTENLATDVSQESWFSCS